MLLGAHQTQLDIQKLPSVLKKAATSNDVNFQKDNMEFSQTRGNCAYSPAIIPLSISVLSYSNSVDTSLMSDLYFAWTSVVSSCTYTCELKAKGC